MPSYEYKCENDSQHFYIEVRSINDPQEKTTCAAEGCGGKLIRVFGAPPIIFNGTGFSAKRG